MKTITKRLLSIGWLLLFPMVTGFGSALAEDFNPLIDPSFKLEFQVVPDRPRLLNKRQIGVYLRVTDNRGQDYRIDAAAIQLVQLNSQTIPAWQLGWLSRANPYQSIETLNGFRQFFKEDYAELQALDQDFFRINRLANRIEIRRIKGKIVAENGSVKKTGDDDRLLQLIGQKLLAGNGLTRNTGYQLVGKTHPSPKLVALLSNRQAAMKTPGKYLNHPNLPDEKTPVVLMDHPANTENRQYLEYLKNHLVREKSDFHKAQLKIGGEEKKELIAFTKLTNLYFFDAAIVNRSTAGSPEFYHFRPSTLNVSTRQFNPSEKANAVIPEIRGYLDTFETEQGSNVLVLDLPEPALHDPFMGITLQIKTQDERVHELLVHLNLNKEDREAYQCRKLNNDVFCELTLNLASSDRELIAYWQDQARDSKWIRLDQRFQKLFTAKDYQSLISLAGDVLPGKKADAEAPLPLVGNWIFLTAESYQNQGKTAEALTWYRTIVNQYPYSDHYVSSWQRLLEQNMRSLFEH